MHSPLLPQHRIVTTNVLEWPKRFKRVEAHRRDPYCNPPMADAVSELVSWLDVGEIGFAELALGTQSDPAAVLRFVWRGRQLACGCDAFSFQSGNVMALRTPISILSMLSREPRNSLLDVLLARMSDDSSRAIPALRVPSRVVVDTADLVLHHLGDSLAEACVRIARGERTGAAKTSAAPCPVSWKCAKGIVEVLAETFSGRPQVVALAQAALEMENWIGEVRSTFSVSGCHLVLRTTRQSLQGVSARKWMSAHSMWHERRPDIDRWLKEEAI
jgi:hypothetical protein